MAALASDVEWNLAGVATLYGDIPLALARMDTVRAEHRLRGTPNPQLQIDRAETLLSVGLYDEVRAEADAAVAALSATGQQVDLPHAVLVLAQAHAAAGDHDAAATAARRARTLFRRQNRAGWATLADVTALRAAELAGTDDRRLLSAALRCAADVQRVGWAPVEMDARMIAARAAGRLGDEGTRRRQLALASAHRRSGTVDARLRGWYAAALLRDALGDRRGAKAALATGLRVLDEQQNLLGATELRANVSAVGSDLIQQGLRLALAAGVRPRACCGGRTVAGPGPPGPGPSGHHRIPALTAALTTVRRLHADTVEAQLSGSAPPSMAERRRAEREVVGASRTAVGPGAGAGSADLNCAELTAALGDRILIEWVEHDRPAVPGGRGRRSAHAARTG